MFAGEQNLSFTMNSSVPSKNLFRRRVCKGFYVFEGRDGKANRPVRRSIKSIIRWFALDRPDLARSGEVLVVGKRPDDLLFF